MITLEAAQAAAESYVALNRTTARVSGLLEDDRDYLIQLEPLEGVPGLVAQAALMLSKRTGVVREEPWGRVFDQVEAMAPVAS